MGEQIKEIKRWTRMLTVPLARIEGPPARIDAKAGKGLHLLLYTATGRMLHVCFTTDDGSQDGYVCSGTTCMSYEGERWPAPEERIWLEGLKLALSQVESQTGWSDFLDMVMRKPAVALPASSTNLEKISSGDSILIRINTRCNAHCEFCSARGTLPDLIEDTELIKQRIELFAKAGQTKVSFSGGEPTLKKELPDLIRSACQAGFTEVDLQTNGILLARPRLVETLAKAGLVSIFLSLHSAEASIHDSMLGVEGAFEKATRAASLCFEAGIEVRFNYVITTKNMTGIVDMVRFVAEHYEHQGTHICLSFVSLQGWALDHLELVPRISQVTKEVSQALELGKRLGLDLRIPGLCGMPICTLPGYEEYFDEYHDDNPPRLQNRSYLADCRECDFRSRCSGFWTAYFDHFGSQEFGPKSAAS
ncbi:MAG: radical SAM protein [Deltaproteobacteria bacterium]|nr:radical SAM protein [Deltaproteobacteria bacterium]